MIWLLHLHSCEFKLPGLTTLYPTLNIVSCLHSLHSDTYNSETISALVFILGSNFIFIVYIELDVQFTMLFSWKKLRLSCLMLFLWFYFYESITYIWRVNICCISFFWNTALHFRLSIINVDSAFLCFTFKFSLMQLFSTENQLSHTET